jgi:hypothetical protein
MSSAFAAVTLEKHSFAIQIQFTSVMNSDSWTLVNVYGPSQGLEDFNFYRMKRIEINLEAILMIWQFSKILSII